MAAGLKGGKLAQRPKEAPSCPGGLHECGGRACAAHAPRARGRSCYRGPAGAPGEHGRRHALCQGAAECSDVLQDRALHAKNDWAVRAGIRMHLHPRCRETSNEAPQRAARPEVQDAPHGDTERPRKDIRALVQTGEKISAIKPSRGSNPTSGHLNVKILIRPLDT